MSWLATLLDLEVNGAKQVPAAVLETYTGKYDGGKIVVTLNQGQIYFLGASGITRKLLPLSDDTFIIEDSSVPPEHQARVRFVKNAKGVVTELQLMIADGRAFPRLKQ